MSGTHGHGRPEINAPVTEESGGLACWGDILSSDDPGHLVPGKKCPCVWGAGERWR
jgi:hypothetical protein